MPKVVFRAVFGPRDREDSPTSIRWRFLVRLESGHYRRYRLFYNVQTRRVSASRSKTKPGDAARYQGDLQLRVDAEEGAIGRTVLAILRSRLTPEDLAACAAASMRHPR